MKRDYYDPYSIRPKVKPGVYRSIAEPPGWIIYEVVGEDGFLMGRFEMREEYLSTATRIDNFERRLERFRKANDVPNIRALRIS